LGFDVGFREFKILLIMGRKAFRRNYLKIECRYCGRLISGNGLAQHNHLLMHSRNIDKILNVDKNARPKEGE
jgi:hypothetical protein